MEITDPVLGESAPDTVWTTANVDEACPHVMSPLCWSVWDYGYEAGARLSQYQLGLVTDEENHSPEDRNQRYPGVFFGRLVANINKTRLHMSRMPGISADSIERDWFGLERDDAPEVDEMPERAPLVLESFARMYQAHPARLAELRDDQTRWWQEEVFDVTRGAEPTKSHLDRLKEARERFSNGFAVHCMTRYFLPAPTLAVTAAVKKYAPELADHVLGGYGGLEEATMTDQLWRVGQGELNLDAFLRIYGFHAPYEGNVYTTSWREEPQRALALAEQYAGRPDFVRPAKKGDELVELRREAERKLLETTPEDERAALEENLRATETLTRDLEVGKSLYVMAFDGCRAAARALGRELVTRGVLDDVEDAFFFTVEELEELEAGKLPGAKELVTYRRQQREWYLTITVPTVFFGVPQPIRLDDSDEHDGQFVTGMAGGGDRVEGRARVVLDPNDEIELEENDILICRMTDPGWAPLMALAAAIVTDVGNVSSHGAVVARELGITYVVGTRNATRVIPDGAHIVVDGSNARIEVLSVAPEKHRSAVGQGI